MMSNERADNWLDSAVQESNYELAGLYAQLATAEYLREISSLLSQVTSTGYGEGGYGEAPSVRMTNE